jgi:hypothetical protein
MATIRSRQHVKADIEIYDEELEIDESDVEETHYSMADDIDLDQPVEEEEEEEIEDDDTYSESSEESDGAVDILVQEDMDKFQETFKGIKDRYRLINRIGEGKFSVAFIELWFSSHTFQGHFLQYIRLKTSNTMSTTTPGIWKRKRIPNGHPHLLRGVESGH